MSQLELRVSHLNQRVSELFGRLSKLEESCANGANGAEEVKEESVKSCQHCDELKLLLEERLSKMEAELEQCNQYRLKFDEFKKEIDNMVVEQ